MVVARKRDFRDTTDMAYVRNASPKPEPFQPVLSKAIATRRDAQDSACSSTWHGELDTLSALARLAVQRTSLLAERKELTSRKAIDDVTNEVIDVALAREAIAFIDTKLATLVREQAILEKHCIVRSPQIWAATEASRQRLKDTVNETLGRMIELW